MFGVDRRQLLLGAGAALLAMRASDACAAAGWTRAAPADAGFTPDLDARLDALVQSKRVWNLHAVLIVRGGRVVLERYFAGEDKMWGRPLGHVAFGPDTLHDLFSVTKSIVALVYGIALAGGKVPAPDVPLVSLFPEYADLFAADPRRRSLTVAHALSMTLGTEWNELNVPYTDARNHEIAMEMAPDRYRFVLERPVREAPGRRFRYSGGATALLGRIIAKGTGRPLPDYARAVLFEPLGVGPTYWINSKETWIGGGDGEYSAASGLRMTPHGLARVGQMVLDGGRADGRQVVPADWLAECLKPRVSADESRRYGYQWYMGDFAFRWRGESRLEHWVGAFGQGGQRLWVMPELALVVAIMAGNYGTDDQWIPPVRIMRELVLQSIQ